MAEEALMSFCLLLLLLLLDDAAKKITKDLIPVTIYLISILLLVYKRLIDSRELLWQEMMDRG